MQTIRHEVWIKAKKERVFDAIATREGLDAWWGKALNAEPKLDYVVEFDHGLGEPLRMKIIDVAPGESVAWKCLSEFSEPGNPAAEWQGHELRFELHTGHDDSNSEWLRERLGIDDEPYSVLRFSHAGWKSDARWFAFCNAAWGATLEGLRLHCESGERAATAKGD